MRGRRVGQRAEGEGGGREKAGKRSPDRRESAKSQKSGSGWEGERRHLKHPADDERPSSVQRALLSRSQHTTAPTRVMRRCVRVLYSTFVCNVQYYTVQYIIFPLQCSHTKLRASASLQGGVHGCSKPSWSVRESKRKREGVTTLAEKEPGETINTWPAIQLAGQANQATHPRPVTASTPT